MKRFYVSLALFITLSNAFAYPRPWMGWNTREGSYLLQSSQINHHVRKLLPYYESQKARANCGIATTVAALNSLALPPSVQLLGIKLFSRSPIYSQSNFFSPQVERIVKRHEVEKRGISLGELKNALRTFHWLKVYPHEGRRLSHNQLRALLISSLKHPNQRVLGLFDRRVLKQRGTGHWSPIAAYNKKTDSFLVLDVAKFKYPPFWVKGETLFKAMQAYNGCQPKGVLIIERIR